MSENHTRCIDHECDYKNFCARYTPEREQGWTYYLHSQRHIMQSRCDEFMEKEAA